jgi:hypothetical protein
MLMLICPPSDVKDLETSKSRGAMLPGSVCDPYRQPAVATCVPAAMNITPKTLTLTQAFMTQLPATTNNPRRRTTGLNTLFQSLIAV